MPENVQLVKCEKKLNEENRASNIWKSDTELNDDGIRKLVGILSSDISIPKPGLHDEDIADDTDDELLYVELPKGSSGGIMRENLTYLRKITNPCKVRINIGDWSEKRPNKPKEGAVIKGLRSNRKEAKKRLLKLAQDCADYKRNKGYRPK